MIRLTEQQGHWLLQLCEQAPAGMSDIQEIGRVVAEQIAHPAHPQDLLDMIADVLQAAGSGSGIGASTVGALQRAVLSPVELARFKANVAASQTCHECKRTFASGEIATMHGKRVFCARCYPPDLAICHECLEPVDVSGVRKTIERAMAKHTCSARPVEPLPVSEPEVWTPSGRVGRDVRPETRNVARQWIVERATAQRVWGSLLSEPTAQQVPTIQRSIDEETPFTTNSEDPD